MTAPPFLPSLAERGTILQSITDVCTHRHWTLLATHVRTNHIHVVIEADTKPEKILHDLKSYSTRALSPGTSHWTRHGSTKYLWTPAEVAINYVTDGQGEPMARTASQL